MGAVDELVANNDRYAAAFNKGDLSAPPRKGVAIVACMDARLDPARVLGLEEGDAHVIRNAGGGRHRRRNPVAGNLAASPRNPGSYADSPHRLRYAYV